MKIYYCNLLNVKGLDRFLTSDIDILASFYGMKSLEKSPYCDSLFIDSGAYSAYKQNITIDIDAYVAFIRKYKELITVYPNLDVIGDAEGTLKNQRYLESCDLSPIPCFHYGEDFDYLVRYCDHDYIAIGGVAQLADGTAILQFLDYCWRLILKHNPKLKVHGFAINDENIISRYPWHSIDASSVHMQARYGGIKMPWGWMKINKNVKDSFALRNQELIIAKVAEWVRSLGLPLDFDDARQETPEATLMRVGISIAYYEQIKMTVFNAPFTKQSCGFGL